MTELKPCPFCGGKAVPPNDRDHHVSCSKCGASGANWAEYDSAIEAWNTRAERTCHVIGFEPGDYETFASWHLSCGHDVPGMHRPLYCSACGAKVVSE